MRFRLVSIFRRLKNIIIIISATFRNELKICRRFAKAKIGSISRWCERVSGGFFREPSNTLGNLGFIIAGLYMFLSLARSSLDNKNESTLLFGSNAIAILYASASTFLGPGSMAMHGTHTGFGAWLDNVSMIAYILILWIYNLKRLFKLSSKIYFFAYTFLLSYFAVSYWFASSRHVCECFAPPPPPHTTHIHP